MLDHGSPVRTTALTSEQVAAVLALVARAETADGFAALNEAALLHLRHGSEDLVHQLVVGADGLIGYGQLEDAGAVVTGSLVVDPDARRRGVGTRLLTAMLGEAGPRLRIWAMHDTPAARRLAQRHGLVSHRQLLIMDRALDDTLPRAEPPAGIVLRTFRPGVDEEAWLAVNARAFAGHPEQGSLTRADLEQRMAEPWFDPAGFFLAVEQRTGAVVGFHWTKQHPGRTGEVYVLGVDLASGWRGLGRPLLAAGLTWLRTVGNSRVLLYVEADNDPAVRLYRGFGFGVSRSDVMYGPDGPTVTGGAAVRDDYDSAQAVGRRSDEPT
jgi:mycothiol synthase